MLAILAASHVVDVGSVLYFSEVWWVGRKSSRSNAARVDREGSLVLPSLLAEALAGEGSCSHPASQRISCMSNSTEAANLHACRITLSHKSTTCVRYTEDD